MNDFIKANDTLIYLWETGGNILVAGCTTNDSISLDREFVEVTPLSTQWRSYKPTYIGGSLAFDSVLFFAENGSAQTDIDQHLDWLLNKTELDFKIVWQSDGNVSGLQGKCYLQNLSITGAVDEFTTGNFSILINGEVSKYVQGS